MPVCLPAWCVARNSDFLEAIDAELEEEGLSGLLSAAATEGAAHRLDAAATVSGTGTIHVFLQVRLGGCNEVQVWLGTCWMC